MTTNNVNLLPINTSLGTVIERNATILLKDGTRAKGDIYRTWNYGTPRYHSYVNGWAGRVYVNKGESVAWMEK